jgi:hypothetical protein
MLRGQFFADGFELGLLFCVGLCLVPVFAVLFVALVRWANNPLEPAKRKLRFAWLCAALGFAVAYAVLVFLSLRGSPLPWHLPWP